MLLRQYEISVASAKSYRVVVILDFVVSSIHFMLVTAKSLTVIHRALRSHTQIRSHNLHIWKQQQFKTKSTGYCSFIMITFVRFLFTVLHLFLSNVYCWCRALVLRVNSFSLSLSLSHMSFGLMRWHICADTRERRKKKPLTVYCSLNIAHFYTRKKIHVFFFPPSHTTLYRYIQIC